jgi:hypothetical protein
MDWKQLQSRWPQMRGHRMFSSAERRSVTALTGRKHNKGSRNGRNLASEGSKQPIGRKSFTLPGSYAVL